VWEQASGQLRRVIAETVDNEVDGEVPVWVSSHQMFVAVLPEGQALSRMTLETRARERAMRDWPRAWKGQLTASVIETGNSSAEPPEEGKLLLVDVKSGSKRPVMSGYIRRSRFKSDDAIASDPIKSALRAFPSSFLEHDHLFGPKTSSACGKLAR